jgi:serine/threonine protein kinase
MRAHTATERPSAWDHAAPLISIGGPGSEVFRARSCDGERAVALRLWCGANSDEVCAAREHLELAARVSHPMLAAVDGCEARGNAALWIVSEYVPGPTLEAWASAGRVLPVSAAIDFMRRFSLGVQAALAQGVSHPAINPRNIVIWRQDPKSGLQLDGKLLDLGLAGWMRPEAPALECAHFMAPETLSGDRAVGARANVYSCGALLYYLTTGELPFKSQSVAQLMAAQAAGPGQLVRPSAYNELISSALECVILGALAVRAGERYASPGEFASVLDAVELRERRAALPLPAARRQHAPQASTTQGAQVEPCAPAMQPAAALEPAAQAFAYVTPPAQAAAVVPSSADAAPPEQVAHATQASAAREQQANIANQANAANPANLAVATAPSAPDESDEPALERLPMPQPTAASSLVAQPARIALQPSAAGEPDAQSEELTPSRDPSAASRPSAHGAELARSPQPAEAHRTAARLLAPNLLFAQRVAGLDLPTPSSAALESSAQRSAQLDLSAALDPLAQLPTASDAEAPGLAWGAAAEERLSSTAPHPTVERSRVARRWLRVAAQRVTGSQAVTVAISVSLYLCFASVTSAPRSRAPRAADSAPVEFAHDPRPLVTESACVQSIPAQPTPGETQPAQPSVECASGPWSSGAEPARSEPAAHATRAADVSMPRAADVAMPRPLSDLSATERAAISSPATAGLVALGPSAQSPRTPAAVGGSTPRPRALAAAEPNLAVAGVARVQALEVRGALTTSAVRRAMEHVRHQWTECYVHVASVTGQIQFAPIHVALVIDEAGRSRDLHITSAEPAAFTECLSRAVRKLTVEVPDTGTVGVVFDLHFDHLY